MSYLIVHPDSHDKLAAVKAVLKALQVDFEESKVPYNAGFVVKMEEGEADIKAGRTVDITLDDIWK